MHNPVVQTLNYLNLCVLFLFVLPVLKNYFWIQSSHVWDDLDIYQFTIWGYFCMYFHVSQAMHIGPFGWFWCTLAAAQGETGGLEVMVPFINDHCFQLQGLVTVKPHPSVLYRDVICTLSTCQWSCGSSEWYQTHELTSHELNSDNMIWSYSFGHTQPGIGRIFRFWLQHVALAFLTVSRSFVLLASVSVPQLVGDRGPQYNMWCQRCRCVMGGSWCMMFEDIRSLRSMHVNLNIIYILQVSCNMVNE